MLGIGPHIILDKSVLEGLSGDEFAAPMPQYTRSTHCLHSILAAIASVVSDQQISNSVSAFNRRDPLLAEDAGFLFRKYGDNTPLTQKVI
jgi:hypothetical protein